MKLTQLVGQIYKNLILTSTNEVWAYFTCPSVYVIGQNQEVQERHKRLWSQFLQSLKRFEDIELFVNPNTYNLKERLTAFASAFDPRAEAMGQALIGETLATFERQVELLTTETVYIGVKLSGVSSAPSLKGKALEWIDQGVSTLLALNQYQLTFDSELIQTYRLLESEVFQLVGTVNGRRLTETELLQAIHYPYIRGLYSSLSTTSLPKDTYSLTDALLDPTKEQGLLELRCLEGCTYLAFLPMLGFLLGEFLN